MTAETRQLALNPALGRVDDVDLAVAYNFPDGVSSWLRATFVSSVDGAATLDGRSGGLGNATDQRIFALSRAAADVVLVGAGTVRVEGYGPAEESAEWRTLRGSRPPTPPVAVVSRCLDLDLSAPLFTDAPSYARTLVLTTEDAPIERRRAAGQVAQVIVAGKSTVDLATAVATLSERGYPRISCEGGPRLLAAFVEANGLDELCLTISPMLVDGGSIRITNGPRLDVPLGLRLAQVLTDGSYLFLRYLRM